MEGWDAHYLGANTPTDSVLRALEYRRADTVAVSATMTFHVGRIGELIDRIRSSSSGSDVRILVGGRPFNVAGDLWEQFGADGYARDAQGAVSVADRLLEETNEP